MRDHDTAHIMFPDRQRISGRWPNQDNPPETSPWESVGPLPRRSEGKGGWILKILAKEVVFLVSSGKKQISPLSPPTRKL